MIDDTTKIFKNTPYLARSPSSIVPKIGNNPSMDFPVKKYSTDLKRYKNIIKNTHIKIINGTRLVCKKANINNGTKRLITKFSI